MSRLTRSGPRAGLASLGVALAVTLVAGGVVGSALAACGSDPQVASGPAPPTLQEDGGAETGTLDAAHDVVITPRPELCDGLTLGGPEIEELELQSDPPLPIGGMFANGTYDLTELDVYVPPQPQPEDGGDIPTTRLTDRSAQITLLVTEFEMRFIEAHRADADAGLMPAETHAVLYRVDGTTLVETAVCPTTATPVAVPFSSAGGGLAIFTDSKHRALFVRRQE